MKRRQGCCRLLAVSIALAWMLGGSCAAFGNGVQFEALGSESPSLFFAARDGFAVRDVDGDGRDDFAFSAKAGFSHLLVVVGMAEDGQVRVKQSLVVPGEELIAVMAASGGASTETLYSLSHLLPHSARLTAYSGWPLEPSRSFELAGVPRAAVIGDVNADGRDEVIVSFADGALRSYSLATGQMQWQTSTQRSASTLALAQLDADPALEVLVGDTAIIVDGATGSSQGGPGAGFGRHVVAAKSGPNGGTQILSAGWDLSAFDGQAPWSWLWTHDSPLGIGSLGTYDADRDGRDEIVYGDAQMWASLHILDAQTRQERFTVQTYDYCICAFATGDLDGDGYQDIAFADGALDGYGRQVRARWADLRRGRWLFALESLDGRFVNVALGDLDRDGRPEQIVASESDYLETTIRVHDAQSGSLKWQSPGGAGQPEFPLSFSASNVLLLPTPQGSDIAVYGNGRGGDSRLVVIDGMSFETRLQWDGRQEPMAYRSIESALAFDYDSDGTADVVAVLGKRAIDGAPPIIAAFSGTTGHLLAVSEPVGHADATLVGMELLPATSETPAAIVLALSDAIRILDTLTFQTIVERPTVSSGIRLSPQTSTSPQLLSFNGSGRVDFHHAGTLALARSIETGLALDAILALGDDSRLLAAADGRLRVIDTATGRTLGTSDWLGTRLASHNRLAALDVGASEWMIVAGGDAGHFRFRLRLVERIFGDGFDAADTPPGR